MVPKKIPNRKCLGCNEMKPKKELIRVIKTNEGEILLDKTGRANGRGAYICPNVNCFENARKTKGFERSLKSVISEEIYDSLLEELKRE